MKPFFNLPNQIPTVTSPPSRHTQLTLVMWQSSKRAKTSRLVRPCGFFASHAKNKLRSIYPITRLFVIAWNANNNCSMWDMTQKHWYLWERISITVIISLDFWNTGTFFPILDWRKKSPDIFGGALVVSCCCLVFPSPRIANKPFSQS